MFYSTVYPELKAIVFNKDKSKSTKNNLVKKQVPGWSFWSHNRVDGFMWEERHVETCQPAHKLPKCAE